MKGGDCMPRVKKTVQKFRALKEELKKEMLDQLVAMNKNTSYNRDLVSSYIYQFDLKETLQKDIDTNGIRIETTSGNGFVTTKPNESVERLKKTNELMLNIIGKLGLDVEITDSDEDVYS